MTDHTDVARNWRGEYPPVAILENTRRALSASVHSAKRSGLVDRTILIDCAAAYRDIVQLENTIRYIRGMKPLRHIPLWVSEPNKFINESTIYER